MRYTGFLILVVTNTNAKKHRDHKREKGHNNETVVDEGIHHESIHHEETKSRKSVKDASQCNWTPIDYAVRHLKKINKSYTTVAS